MVLVPDILNIISNLKVHLLTSIQVVDIKYLMRRYASSIFMMVSRADTMSVVSCVDVQFKLTNKP